MEKLYYEAPRLIQFESVDEAAGAYAPGACASGVIANPCGAGGYA